jgi:hypothetical protein
MRGAPHVLAGLVTLSGACGVFSLNDVVPVSDAGGDDGPRTAADAQGDSPSQADGQATEAGADATTDATTGDVATDAPPICDAADPCSCLAPPTVLAIGGGGTMRSLHVGTSVATWLVLQGSDPVAYQASIDGDGGEANLLPTHLGPNPPGDFDPVSAFMYFVEETAPTWEVSRGEYDAAAADPLLKAIPSAPADLAATNAALFWTNTNAELCKLALDGDIPAGDSGCGGVALSPGQPGANGGNHALVSASSIWLSVQDSGELRRVPLSGGAGTLVTTLSAGVSRALAGDDSAVFWFETQKSGDAGVVYRESAAGGAPTPLASAPLISMVIADATQVYYLTGSTDLGPIQIYSVPRSGGPSTLLACESAGAQTMAVDSQYVYWADVNGRLLRASK